MLTIAVQYGIIILKEVGFKEPVSAKEIMGKHNLSYSFTEQICGRLRRAGLLSPLRGPNGGYVRTRVNVTLLEINDILSQRKSPMEILPGAAVQINKLLSVMADTYI